MSEYILDLRKIVGHRPLLQVGASLIVENELGQVLLQRRADNHCWGYAGGSVELDEVIEEAAKRELLEETGLTAHTLELFGVFSVYLCRSYSGELKRQESEVEVLCFFSPDAMPEKISPPNQVPLQKWAASKHQ